MYDPDRLKFHMEKRIQNTMIGAIARVEKVFGYMWGQQKSENEILTDEEEKFLDMWEYLRNDILNYGNKQIRSIGEDFNKYGGVFRTNYRYNFNLRKDDNDENR